MELITVGENQYIFQNIKGQKYIRSSEFYDGNKKRRFILLGIKINNIAYILVGALETVLCYRRYRYFPSPNWTELNSQVVGSSHIFV
jgi:hypothetical protein